MIAVALAVQIAGFVPQGLTAPSRVIWIDSDPSPHVTCRLAAPRGWECEGAFDPARGLVVVVGENGVAYQRLVAGDGSGTAITRWGRLVIVTSGSVAPEDVRDVRIATWTPVRPRTRLQSKRLTPVKDTSIEVVRLAETAFWIAGGDSDPDAFLTLEGPAIASTRVAIAGLADGPPETPVYVPAAMPFPLDGRVQTAKGEDVDGADIELFQPPPTFVDDPSLDLASQSLIRAAATRSDQNGRFSFGRLSTGPFLISVLDGTRGRGISVVRSLGEPVVIRLVAPITATGRVLRNRLPVADARVRFIPSMDALLASADATALAAEDRTTAADGRFAFQLPPVTTGTIQVIGPDGASIRIPVSRPSASGHIDIGDVSLPDHRQLTVRLVNADACVLSATGPLDGLGLTIVRATAAGPMIYAFDIPEPGTWALDAECAGRSYNVEPLVVDIAATGPTLSIEARVIR